jgi:hypothetical protein
MFVCSPCKEMLPTHRLVVEGLNNPLAALSRYKDHLDDDERLHFDNLAALHLTTDGGHGALHVGGRGSWCKIMTHDGVRAGKAANGHSHGRGSRWRRRANVDEVLIVEVHALQDRRFTRGCASLPRISGRGIVLGCCGRCGYARSERGGRTAWGIVD